jgi:PAS domain S-box-containing protein
LERRWRQRILVVEDEKEQALVIARLLKHKFGADVEIAESCEEARAMMEDSAFDLVTLDYQLPDGDGLQLLSELQETPGAPPAIMVTGHGDEQAAVSAFKLGASGYVVKDARMPTMLVEECRSALARAELARAEAALAESENRLQEIFDASSYGIMTFDEEGMLELINKASMAILGIDSLDDVKEFSLFGRPYLSEDLMKRLIKGEPVKEIIKYDFDVIRREGLYTPQRSGGIFLEGSATPLMSADSEDPRGYLVQFEDVTERVRNENAVKAQRDLAVVVLSTDVLEDALGQILSAVIEATGLDAGGIYVYDTGTGQLTLTCHQGIREDFAEAVKLIDKDDPRVKLVLEGKSVYTTYGEIPTPGGEPDTSGLKAFAVVPLVAGQEVLGAMNLGSRSMDEMPAELKDVIESLSGEAAQAIKMEMTSVALREERDRIKRIIDALPVGMVLLDREGRLLMQNKGAKEMSKLSSEQEESRTDSSPEWETTDWDGNPMPLEETPFMQAISTGRPATGIRLSALTGHGERIYVSESAAPMFNEDGEIESILLTLEDMSDLRNALVTVREGERIYRETVESLNEGLWVLDADYKTSFVSDRMAEMLAYRPEEMLGVSVFDFADDEGKEKMRQRLENRRQGISEQYDFEFLRRDGTRLLAYLAAAPIMDRDGNFMGSHAGVLDITDRKRMEKALQESVMLFKTEFETSPDGVAVADLNGNIRSASRREAEMLGYGSPEEMEGLNVLDLIVPEQRDLARDSYLDTLKEGILRDLEFEILRKDGTTFCGGVNAAALRDADGQQTGFIATTRDMTNRKKTEQALQALNTELEGYAHIVSHDLKGPISSLMMSAAMLKKTIELIDDRERRIQLKELADIIESSSGRANDLVYNLLILAESGQEPQQVEEVSIDEVVDTVLEEKRGEILNKGVKIERSYDLGTVRADPTHIYQLVSNLVANGIGHNDASEPTLRIIRLEDAGPEHRFSVCDNSSGISEDLIDHVFEPFSRGEGGGVGLGLSIVQKVARVYGGSVKAKNDNGACFEVTLKDYP